MNLPTGKDLLQGRRTTRLEEVQPAHKWRQSRRSRVHRGGWHVREDIARALGSRSQIFRPSRRAGGMAFGAASSTRPTIVA